MTLVQNELKKCYVGMGYTAMQGPCNEGYHIPTHVEWNNVKTILGELGWNNTSGATLKEALYIPYSGHIARGNAVYDHSLNRGHLRCCDTDGVYAYELDFSDGYININNDSNACRAYGYSIRPFKDVPVTPSSSWAIIDDGSDAVNPVNGAGIYHDATNGIISISSDAINWITIADKNLGATNVYSNGNTLSESNCGKYYQWGNNYGFPWNGSISSSSTLVDASMYGPENYYSNSTFILENSSVGDWSSIQNNNLWGGVSGLSPNKVKKIMLGSTKIRPVWQPGANTIIYVPMKNDLLDHGPNNISLTNTSVTIQNVSGVSAGYFPAQNNKYNLRGDITSYISDAPFTISVWVNALELPTGSNPTPFIAICGMLASGPYRGFSLRLLTSGFNAEFLDGNNAASSSIPTLNNWYLITATRDSSNSNKLYVNSQLVGSSTGWNKNFSNFVIGADRTDNEGLLRHWRGYMSEFIMEKAARTATEVLDYYNLTKGIYGL